MTPAMITMFQTSGESAATAEAVVGLQDPDEQPVEAEQQHDREEHLREPGGQRARDAAPTR